MNDFTRGYMRGYKDAQKEALAQSEQRSNEHLEPVAWVPYLSDRADGVKGHYAIARWNPRGYREVWNLRRHEWGAYSDDVLSLEEADTLLRLITIPTRKVTSPQPPQRTTAEGEDTKAWVGLTDEDKQKIMWTFTEPTGLFKHFKYMEAVEAKLKEKNERLEKNT